MLGLLREQARKDIPKYIPLPRSAPGDKLERSRKPKAIFKIGDRVHHLNYGDGVVIATSERHVTIKLDNGDAIEVRGLSGLLRKHTEA